MVPTKDRNVQAIYMSYQSEGILIDCGEGTQRQMNLAGINRNKVTTILITHWHGDHVGGIIGLLQTISNKDVPPKIEIYGPIGTKKSIQHLLDSVIFEQENLDLRITELDPEELTTIKETDDYYIQAANMQHTTSCVAYSFVEKDKRKIKLAKAKEVGLTQGPIMREIQNGNSVTINGKLIEPDDVSFIKKGRKITFVFDTIPNKNAIDLAKNSDLLISESVYLPDMSENAAKYKHLTTADAGLIATNAEVKRLIITHFSQRYKDISVLESSIKDFFTNAECSYDLMRIKL